LIAPAEFIEPAEPDEGTTTSSRFNGVRLSSRTIPAAGAARGGDWCESFAISSDVIAISIGDICGRGAEKFEAMATIRQTIRDAALGGLDPAQTLVQANRVLLEYDPDETATAIFALLDTRRRSLSYANAGHPPPLMLGPCGTLFLEYPGSDMPLGVERAFFPALHVVNAPASTLFVFYTDGVSESERDSLLGATKLRAAGTFARDFPELPAAATIEALTLTASNFDDAAILTAWMPLFPMVRRRQVGRVKAPTCARSRRQFVKSSS
jgi:serine phosphatase RsbU (regulator of sigma subunit)